MCALENWTVVWYTLLTLFVQYVVYRVVKWKLRQNRLNKAIQERRSSCRNFAANLKDCLSTSDAVELEERRLIVHLRFSDLLDKLLKEELKPTVVLAAYQWQALNATSEGDCNCVVQFIQEAQRWAQSLEEEYGRERKPKPPLYGVPISLKESFMVKGYDATRGYAHQLEKICDQDASVVSILKQLGAVPFVRTNVPQTLLSYSCSNPIYGRTTHPTHHTRTCGGSTGGEAALLARYGSVLGVGGDVGGSIRIPAHFSGIVGFKPTSTRMSQLRANPSIPGRPLMAATLGPMARDVEALVAFMKNVLCDSLFHVDPYVSPVKFRDEIYNNTTPLTIGFYETDDFFQSIPACQRVVRKSKELLESLGHTLVPFSPPSLGKALHLLISAATVDGGHYITKHLAQDIVDPSVRLMNTLYNLPYSIRYLLAALMQKFDPRTAIIVKSFPKNTAVLREIYEEIGKYRYSFVEQWKQAKLDALICPPSPIVSVPDEVMSKLMSAATYPALYNLLDFPAGVVQCSAVTSEDEAKIEQEYLANDLPSYIVRKYCGPTSGSVKLPIGIQVVTMHSEDELCLRLMAELERIWSNLPVAEVFSD